MTVLFPSWFLALPGLSAAPSGAAQCLSWAQIPCSWAALDVPSPAHIQHTQQGNKSVNSACPQTCLAWPDQPQQLSRTDLTGRLSGAGDCGIHMAVGTFVCVCTNQLTATEHRTRAWAMTDPSAHLYRLPGDAQTCTTAGRGRALVPSMMSHLQVGGGGHLALGKKQPLPCFVSAQNTPCQCLCTCM